jgi:hypothetical protein
MKDLSVKRKDIEVGVVALGNRGGNSFYLCKLT